VFSGRTFWEFQGHELAAGFPESGRALTELGIESLVERIDAAAVGLGTLNNRTYVFSGYEYWRLSVDRRRGHMMAVDRHYPQEISHVFRGVPPNVDAAFTNVDGNDAAFTPDRGAATQDNAGNARQRKAPRVVLRIVNTC